MTKQFSRNSKMLVEIFVNTSPVSELCSFRDVNKLNKHTVSEYIANLSIIYISNTNTAFLTFLVNSNEN